MELHIGIDTEKVVVSPYALKTRTGRARRRRTGSVTEVLPVPSSGRSREARLAYAARLALSLIFASAVLFAFGVPWLLLLGASVGAVGLLWHHQARAARPGIFAVPADEQSTVLWTPQERAAYQRAVVVSRRIRNTWPDLPDMIDPASADRSLTHALADLATLLTRRQEIRRLRSELSAVRPRAVPVDSPALLALDAQRERVERLWLATGEQANRILRSLDATATAGETFRHEQRIGATARAAEQVLTALAVGVPAAETGPELAAGTDAVIAAYRELAGVRPPVD
jgi:hypothetical protein